MSIFLVTGGAGFIGSAFVRTLLGAYPDASVINIDALTYAGSMANLEGLDRQRHRFIHGDICDRDTVLKAIPENCDAVFNFAAESHVDRSLDSADKFIRTNVLGTQVLLDAVHEKRVRRFIQISTDEVMGSLSENTEELFTETSPLRPNSPYAASKAAAEMLVRAAVVSHGVDAVIPRSGNNYGPRPFPEKLIQLVIKNALDERPLPIYGDGMNVRDWIHVDDNCRAVLLAYEKGHSGETYNIGAGCQKRNLDVVRFILKEMNKPESLIEFVTDRPGHDRRYATDPNKAETELGWKPEIIWENGMKQTTAWYVDKWNKERPLKK